MQGKEPFKAKQGKEKYGKRYGCKEMELMSEK